MIRLHREHEKARTARACVRACVRARARVRTCMMEGGGGGVSSGEEGRGRRNGKAAVVCGGCKSVGHSYIGHELN